MQRWLKYMALATLLIMALDSCIPKRDRLPLDQHGAVIQTVYVDENFSFDEYLIVKSAADEWTHMSRGVIQFALIYPYHVEDATLLKPIDRKIVVKVKSTDPFVIKTDHEIETDNKKKGINTPMVALGFWQLNELKGNLWFIGLVTDRIETNYKLRVVAIHEFGHAIRMKHREDDLGIMNAQSSFKDGCLNRYDALQFAEVYDYQLETLNYCVEN